MLKQKILPSPTLKSLMTKTMQNSINILSMRTLDLKEYIEESLYNNPFLKLERDDFDSSSSGDFKDLMPKDNKNSKKDFIDNIRATELSLKEHLCQQIDISFKDANEKILAYKITDYIDDNGYLIIKADKLAAELKVSASNLKAVLNALQGFDPIGVYCDDLQDCLRLQAIEQGFYSEKFAILLKNLHLLANFEMKALLVKCGVNKITLNDMVRKLHALNPKPGLKFNNALAQIVVPEIIFEKDSNDKIKVFLNRYDMPRICFHESYYMDMPMSSDSKAKAYIKDNKKMAADLINALNKRNALLIRFGMEISDLQYEYFMYGQEYLKPMTIKDLAQRLDVHESTISRLSNKYVQTMYGTVPIKFFFSSKLPNLYTEQDNSSKAIKKYLKDLVETENINNVLSDRQLCDILQHKYNVVISRRTVAKYRDQLKIASSAKRKKQKLIFKNG